MIAIIPPGKTDEYATDDTGSNCVTSTTPEYVIYSEPPASSAEEEDQYKPEPQDDEDDQQETWIHDLGYCRVGIRPPRPNQKASSYG